MTSHEPVLDHAGLEVLTPAECESLLARSPVGRIAFIDEGEPVVLPVTMGVWERSIVFTTGPGSKLAAAIMNRPVAIEVDGWDDSTKTGWSVLAKGMAEVVDDGREIDALDRLSVRSFVRPDDPKTWVRVLPNEITGRRVPGTRNFSTTRRNSS